MNKIVNQIKLNVEKESSLQLTLVEEGSSYYLRDNASRIQCNITNVLDDVERGLITAENVALQIAKEIQLVKDALTQENSLLHTRNYILNNVILTLVSYEACKDDLAYIPHTKFMDLAITYFCPLYSNENTDLSVRITNDTLKMLNICENELQDAATKNTVTSGFEIKNILQTIEEITAISDVSTLCDDDMPLMYVASNRKKLYGANVLLFSNVYDELAEKLNSNLFILPSSRHEIILVPEIAEIAPSYLKQIVEEVNASCVDSKDRLSNSVYFWNYKSKSLYVKK